MGTKIKGRQVEQFSNSNPGVVPTSPGGDSKYLREDGTWSTPSTGNSPISVELDFGTISNKIRRFVFNYPGVTSSTIIQIIPNPLPATDRKGNDWEIDNVNFTYNCTTDTIEIVVNGDDLVGKRNIYLIIY